jgi:hypothetical protein
MDPNRLVETALSLEHEVLDVLPLGGYWEIWFQVQLARGLRRDGIDVKLEVDYGSEKPKRMDLVLQDDKRIVTVELKVESANFPGIFAGSSFEDAVGGDIFKSREFIPSAGNLAEEDRWALAVGHSPQAIARMDDLYNDTPPSYFGRGAQLQAAQGQVVEEQPETSAGIAAAVYVSQYY